MSDWLHHDTIESCDLLYPFCVATVTMPSFHAAGSQTMSRLSRFLPLVLLTSSQVDSGLAFVPATPSFIVATGATMHPSFLFSAVSSSSFQDLNQARAAFEQLMKEQHTSSYSSTAIPTSKEEYVPPPLTESARRRRYVEMDLLASLEDSDDAIDELMSLWLVERDAESAMRLNAMESECSPGLVEEEAALRAMVNEYGVDWAEPVSRLAGLLFFKGETEESEYWCRVALAVKPWHFEAIQTLVLNALRRKDLASALQWRRKGLPPLHPAASDDSRARKAWVRSSLRDAQEALRKAEEEARRLHQLEDMACDDLESGCELWQ